MATKTDVWQGTLALMVLTTLDAMGPLHGYGIARRPAGVVPWFECSLLWSKTRTLRPRSAANWQPISRRTRRTRRPERAFRHCPGGGGPGAGAPLEGSRGRTRGQERVC